PLPNCVNLPLIILKKMSWKKTFPVSLPVGHGMGTPCGRREYRWPKNNIPYIGPSKRSFKHTYVATGYFADGLVYGTLAGLLIGDIMLENKNPTCNPCPSGRFDPSASVKFVIKENTNTFCQYLQDYPLFGPNNFNEIKPGEGKVLEINREK